MLKTKDRHLDEREKKDVPQYCSVRLQLRQIQKKNESFVRIMTND